MVGDPVLFIICIFNQLGVTPDVICCESARVMPVLKVTELIIIEVLFARSININALHDAIILFVLRFDFGFEGLSWGGNVAIIICLLDNFWLHGLKSHCVFAQDAPAPLDVTWVCSWHEQNILAVPSWSFSIFAEVGPHSDISLHFGSSIVDT